MSYTGRSIDHIQEEFGPFRYHKHSRVPYYVSKPWYAPVGGHWSVEIYHDDREMFMARIDD